MSFDILTSISFGLIREYTQIVESAVEHIYSSNSFDNNMPLDKLSHILLRMNKDYPEWKIDSVKNTIRKSGGRIYKDDFIYEMLHNPLLKEFIR